MNRDENTLYVNNRADWRQWLSENSGLTEEVWLVYPRKHTGKPRIPYNDAVEEALCFGWIDSITRTIDDAHYAQRFTPRRARSSYSQTNKERLRRLLAQDKVLPEIAAAVVVVLEELFSFPGDILAALQENDAVWENFQRYSEAYRRIRVAYVDTARNQPGEFDKRLQNLVKKTAQNTQFGFGIEDYY